MTEHSAIVVQAQTWEGKKKIWYKSKESCPGSDAVGNSLGEYPFTVPKGQHK